MVFTDSDELGGALEAGVVCKPVSQLLGSAASLIMLSNDGKLLGRNIRRDWVMVGGLATQCTS